jgi:excisionase family DNA binding protein
VTTTARDGQARLGVDGADAENPPRARESEAPQLELRVAVGADALEAVAERAAELVLAQLGGLARSPYLTVVEAADYLRCSRQRVDDLLSQGRLTRLKDGARTLVERSELDAYLRSAGARAASETLPLRCPPGPKPSSYAGSGTDARTADLCVSGL